MAVDLHNLLEASLSGRPDPDAIVARSVCRADLRREIAAAPRAHDLGDEDRVLATGEEMVGLVERHEALRVPGGLKDPPGDLDPDDLVGGRMKDEERPAQVVDSGLEILAPHVVEELLRHGKSPPGEFHFSLSLPLNRGHMGTKAGDHVL